MTIKKVFYTLHFCWKIGANLRSKLGLCVFIIFNSIWLRVSFLKKKVIKSQKIYDFDCFLPDKRAISMRLQDASMFVEMFRENIYALPFFDKNRSAKTVVDLGSNIGLATLFFASKYGSAGQFIVVEPSPENLVLLEKNLKNNKIRAEILRGVVSASANDVYLTEDALGYQIKISDTKTTLKVKAWTMPDIIHQFNLKKIDILKIDIKGAEKALLAQADWLKIVKNLLIEIHDDYTLENLTHDLTPYGFKIKPINERTVFLAQRLND